MKSVLIKYEDKQDENNQVESAFLKLPYDIVEHINAYFIVPRFVMAKLSDAQSGSKSIWKRSVSLYVYRLKSLFFKGDPGNTFYIREYSFLANAYFLGSCPNDNNDIPMYIGVVDSLAQCIRDKSGDFFGGMQIEKNLIKRLESNTHLLLNEKFNEQQKDTNSEVFLTLILSLLDLVEAFSNGKHEPNSLKAFTSRLLREKLGLSLDLDLLFNGDITINQARNNEIPEMLICWLAFNKTKDSHKNDIQEFFKELIDRNCLPGITEKPIKEKQYQCRLLIESLKSFPDISFIEHSQLKKLLIVLKEWLTSNEKNLKSLSAHALSLFFSRLNPAQSQGLIDENFEDCKGMIPSFIALLKDNDSLIRRYAANVLRLFFSRLNFSQSQVLVDNLEDCKGMLPSLLALLKDNDSRTRLGVASALRLLFIRLTAAQSQGLIDENLEDFKSMLPSLIALFKDNDSRTRLGVASVFGLLFSRLTAAQSQGLIDENLEDLKGMLPSLIALFKDKEWLRNQKEPDKEWLRNQKDGDNGYLMAQRFADNDCLTQRYADAVNALSWLFRRGRFTAAQIQYLINENPEHFRIILSFPYCFI